MRIHIDLPQTMTQGGADVTCLLLTDFGLAHRNAGRLAFGFISS
jgi:hypothetical protein